MANMKMTQLEVSRGGAFDFSNCARNMALVEMGVKPPTLRSTGTTIVAATYKVRLSLSCASGTPECGCFIGANFKSFDELMLDHSGIRLLGRYDGLVMGADSRATAGNIIADKHCTKVHKLTESMFACGAGTAADLDQVTKMLSAQLRLLELNTGKKARVITAVRRAKQHLFQYMGYIGAYLLIGGVDPT
uniref:Proteasome endopeptidase complex n=1 Tax=Parascaris equorum TaxID=6256 RepID=A0A914RYW6_PAREQ